MNELTDEFNDYLENIGVETNEEDKFCHRITIEDMVRRLLLLETFHNGIISAMSKCRELGLYKKYGDYITFKD